MKIFGKLLTLSLLHPSVWETAAFHVHAPSAFSTRGVRDSSRTELGVSGGPPPPAAAGPDVGAKPVAGGPGMAPEPGNAGMMHAKDIWDTLSPVTVQGGSLRTWSFADGFAERVQVLMKTEGRPLNANVELWQGPDNTPQIMGVYLENGNMRPFSAVIETPRGTNSIAIRNSGDLEFPLAACVEADNGSAGLGRVTKNLAEKGTPRKVQGGAVHTYPFDPSVASVQVLLTTDGRPLNARIELLQGPNNIKQVIELYTEDGMERPFFAVLESPGTGNVIRIVNTATMEYPLTACVEPYLVEAGYKGSTEPVIGGGDGRFASGRPTF